jgi:hypothetical protein
MKFRMNRNRPVIVETAIREDELVQDSGADPGRKGWSTAFLIAGSALMGATALAFWNRRTIAGLRSQIEAMSSQTTLPAPPIDDEIV